MGKYNDLQEDSPTGGVLSRGLCDGYGCKTLRPRRVARVRCRSSCVRSLIASSPPRSSLSTITRSASREALIEQLPRKGGGMALLLTVPISMDDDDHLKSAVLFCEDTKYSRADPYRIRYGSARDKFYRISTIL
ncbi:hypothetical protein evm_002925 [Chilo suppressalis]|nr:hypothetical protein evm_002925 [Chilo suppressalis]